MTGAGDKAPRTTTRNHCQSQPSTPNPDVILNRPVQQPGRLFCQPARSLQDPPTTGQTSLEQTLRFHLRSRPPSLLKGAEAPRAFLHTANSKHNAITPFGHTHSTRTPKQWAAQTLGPNFVTASVLFLLRATATTTPALAAAASVAPKSPRPPLGADLAFFRPRKILRADDPPMILASKASLTTLLTKFLT